jgi:hypothetical protein
MLSGGLAVDLLLLIERAEVQGCLCLDLFLLIAAAVQWSTPFAGQAAQGTER